MTVEELLEELIEVEESAWSDEFNIDSSMAIQLQSMSSKIDVLSSENQVLSSQLDNINQSQGAYTSEEIRANNSSFYSDFVSIKEMQQYQFIFFGVIVGLLIILVAIKGFSKNVS